jgi:hypothetical protein
MEQGGLAKGIAVMTTWLALGSMVVPAIHAADFKTGEQVTVDAGQTIDDDLYMTGDTLTVLGIVDGDVVASARIIRIEGTVLGDLIAAGQVISIGGEVRDDVRIGGMTLKLEEDAVIGDDVFAAGFSFESAPGSRVQGKTHLSGYQGSLEGEHQQGLEASLVGLRISGTVLGGVEASVRSQSGPAWWVRFMQSPIPLPSVEPGLEITSQATIGGDLSYRSVAEASIGEGAQLGGKVVHEAREAADEPKDSPGAKLGRAGRWILVLFLFGAALLWLVPDKLLGMTRQCRWCCWLE